MMEKANKNWYAMTDPAMLVVTFGNQKLKASRALSTGSDAEASRVKTN